MSELDFFSELLDDIENEIEGSLPMARLHGRLLPHEMTPGRVVYQEYDAGCCGIPLHLRDGNGEAICTIGGGFYSRSDGKCPAFKKKADEGGPKK